MKALILAPYWPSALERLRQSMEVTYESWMDTKKLLSSEEFITRIQDEGIDVLVVEADFVLREVYEKATNLGFLGICRADTNHVDINAATEYGVLVVNVPARNNVAVAELALGLMLSLIRNIPKAHNMVISRSWVDPTAAYFSMRGTELTDKTVGIVGFGAIGKRLSKMLTAFNASVLAYDPYVGADTFAEYGVKQAELDELMEQSDFVTLHCITTPETAGLIDARRISLMKPTAYLIDTASTYVIDMDAIVQALKEKRIAGAGFDVYDSWPVRADSPLLDLDNVVLTPHIGGATYETIVRYSNIMADDIERFRRGERPRNLLNPQVWDKGGR